MNNIKKMSFYTIIIQLLTQATMVLLNLFIAKELSIYEYGEYIFGFSIAMFITSLMSSTMTTVFAKIFGITGSNSVLLSHLNWCILVSMLIVWPLLFIFGLFGTGLWTVSVYFFVPISVLSFISSYFIAIQKAIYGNFLQLIVRFIFLIVFIIHAYFLSSIVNFIIMSIVCSLLFLIFIIFFKLKISTYKIKVLPKETFSFLLLSASSVILSFVGVFILKIIGDYRDVAIYSLAVQMVAGLLLVLRAISTNVITNFSKSYYNYTLTEFRLVICSATNIVFKFSAVTMLLSFVGAYVLVRLYGDGFHDAFYVFLILSCGNFFHVFNGNNGLICNMTGNHKYTTIATLVSISLNLILGFVFVYYFGVYGMAISSGIGLVVWNVILSYICVAKIGVNPTIFRFLDRFLKEESYYRKA